MTRTEDVTAELIPLTGVSPRAALAAARSLLAGKPGPREASVAHQAAAIVLRDFGDVHAAIREFRLAVRLARAAADPDREADVLTSLGTALVMAGRTQAGLAALDDALARAGAGGGGGAELGRILVRRGGSLHIAGRYAEAQVDLRKAIALTRRAHDDIWTARALTAAALADLAVGATARAEAALAAAEPLFAGSGQRLEIAYARHNRALVAFASGDLPGALRHLDDAVARYAELGVSVPDAALDRGAVLLAAGLTGIALAAGRPGIAAERAWLARSMFTRQRRDGWRNHATYVLLHARFLDGRAPGRLLPEARRTAARLEDLRSDEAPDAWLLAGQIALAAAPRVPAGSEGAAEADRLLARAARASRRRVPAFARAVGWLAQALRAEQAADTRRLLAACGRGFGLLEEHLATLGAAELRAHATAHGAELAHLAQRAALGSGRPRLLLQWSERWRAVALEPPRPSGDPGARADLAALRAVTARLEKARPGGFPATVLHRERLRLEAAVRGRTLRAAGGRQPATSTPFDPAALLTELGQARLLELVVVDGDLHVLVCGDGRVRRVAAGAAGEAAREVDFARFALNRMARGHLAEPPEQALAALAEAGRRLDALLLGPARDRLGEGPVVIVPPGRLNAVPWALLPSLRERAVTVAPSARTWIRAATADPFGPHKTVLVSGPGLGAARAEVRTLAAEYGPATVLAPSCPGGPIPPDPPCPPVVLAGRTATAARVLEAIDGAGLAHIAAHGVFRADSPMFSSLRLADGPVTVHDLERLRRAPFRLILPSCDSGRLAPAGADELLGLHRGLRAEPGPAGPGTLAAALRDARADASQATAADPVVTAAGWSFIALGA